MAQYQVVKDVLKTFCDPKGLFYYSDCVENYYILDLLLKPKLIKHHQKSRKRKYFVHLTNLGRQINSKNVSLM